MNRRLIKAFSIIEDLQKEVKSLKPTPLYCEICDSKLKQHSRVAAEGEEDWMEVTTLYVCPKCAEVIDVEGETNH